VADFDLPALLARAQKGDRAAFDRFVHGTARLVYAQIVLSVRDRHQAEDLAQETYLAAWKGLPALQAAEHQPRSAVNWLLTLARNKVLDRLKFDRRIKRGGTVPGDPGAAASTSDPVVPTPSSAGTPISRLAPSPAPTDDVAPTPSSVARAASSSPWRPHDPADLPDDAPTPAESAELREARQRALDILDELPDEYRRPLAMRYLADADYQTIRRALDLSDGALRGLLTRGMALLRERMTQTHHDQVPQ
jgi:RNA polymerase sigma-70 factor, ECF subfamily